MCTKGDPSTQTQGTSTLSSVGTTTPSAQILPYYENYLKEATNLATTPFNPSTKGTVAGLTNDQLTAIQNAYSGGLSAGDFDPSQVAEIMSPYTQKVVGSTQDWFNNQNAIQSSGLLGQAIRSGNAFGGDRAGIAQAQLGGQQQLAQAPVIAGLYEKGYTQALDEYNKLKQFGMVGAEQALKASSIQQQQTQRELDTAQQNAMMEQAFPFQKANWYGSVLGGIGPLMGSVSTQDTAGTTAGTTTPPQPSTLVQALGLASSVVGVGKNLFTKDGGAVRGLARGGSTEEQEQEQEGAGDVTFITPDGVKRVPNYMGQLTTSGRDPYGSRRWQTLPKVPNPIANAASGTGGTDTGSGVFDVLAKGAKMFGLEEGGSVRRLQMGGPDDDDDEEDVEEQQAPDDEQEEEVVGASAPAANQFTQTFGAQGPGLTPTAATPSALPAGAPPGVALRPEPVPGAAQGSAAEYQRRTGTWPPAPGLGPVEPDPNAVNGGGGQRRGMSVQTIPGMADRPSFWERVATEPLIQAGIAGMTSRQTNVMGGIGDMAAGFVRGAGQRAQLERLDAKPQVMGGGSHIRVGNKLIETGLPGTGKGGKEAGTQKRFETRQEAIDRRHKENLAERARQFDVKQGGKGEKPDKDLVKDQVYAREIRNIIKDLKTDRRYVNADDDTLLREAIKRWNSVASPKNQRPVPEPPVVEPPKVAPKSGGFWQGIGESIGAVDQRIRNAEEEAARKRTGAAPATAAPATPAQRAAPSRPSTVPAGTPESPAQWNPLRRMWRSGGKFYDESGKEVAAP